MGKVEHSDWPVQLEPWTDVILTSLAKSFERHGMSRERLEAGGPVGEPLQESREI